MARAACNTRRVRKLIRARRLGPCWMPLDEGQGIECPVCMELYMGLNHTACCHQDICTECFISIVAPGGGAAARCPYCQARALQVYLPQPSRPQPAVQSAEAAAACGDAAGAAANDGAPAQLPRPAGGVEEGQLLLILDGDADGGSYAPSGRAGEASTDVVVVGALASGLSTIAATAEATSQATEAAAPASSARQRPKPGSSGGASLAALLAAAGPRSRRSQVEALAEAAGAASRQLSLTVGMVVVAAPDSSTAAPRPGSSGAGSSTALAAASPSEPSPLAGAAAGCPAEGAAVAADAAAGGHAATDAAPPANLAGCPALLLNPDGTQQLVLLGSGQPAAEAAEGSQAARCLSNSNGQQQHQAEPAVQSYQAPSNPEDDRMRAAIARADAALLRPPHRARDVPPAGGSRRGGDWLEQLRQADAALRAAVARNDQQRFGGAAAGASERADS